MGQALGFALCLGNVLPNSRHHRPTDIQTTGYADERSAFQESCGIWASFLVQPDPVPVQDLNIDGLHRNTFICQEMRRPDQAGMNTFTDLFTKFGTPGAFHHS